MIADVAGFITCDYAAHCVPIPRGLVLVEVRDDQPPADGGAWEAQGEAGMDVPSGQVREWTYGGPCEDAIELGEAGRRWHARVNVSGRDRVRELAEQEVPVHAERYLLQFWPA
jgi:hypothetical protein